MLLTFPKLSESCEVTIKLNHYNVDFTKVIMKFLHIISRNKAKEIGIKSYFTGHPCKRGHYSLRRVSNQGCVDCDLDRMREYNKTYYKENYDVFEKNRIKLKQRKPEYSLEYGRLWRSRNPNYSNEYRKMNLSKYRAYNAKRRAAIKEAGGFYSDMDISEMFEQQEGICHGCKGSLDILGYHVDHKIPLDKGGSNWPENLQLLCPTCNLKKSNKDYEDWLRTVEKYE